MTSGCGSSIIDEYLTTSYKPDPPERKLNRAERRAQKYSRPVLIPRNYANRADMRRIANGETKVRQRIVKDD